MEKTTVRELTKHLKAEAKRLQSDWNDVPQWVIAASVKFFNDKIPSGREEILQKADEYLVPDNETSVEDMVKLIAAHEDETEIIDYIDGVTVWEKVEFSFTVKDFLFTIGYNKKYFK